MKKKKEKDTIMKVNWSKIVKFGNKFVDGYHELTNLEKMVVQTKIRGIFMLDDENLCETMVDIGASAMMNNMIGGKKHGKNTITRSKRRKKRA